MHSVLFAAFNEKVFDLSVSYDKRDRHRVPHSLALATARRVPNATVVLLVEGARNSVLLW